MKTQTTNNTDLTREELVAQVKGLNPVLRTKNLTKKDLLDYKKSFLNEHQERMKELKSKISTMKRARTEENRPTVWFNSKIGLIEIHYNNKTVIARVESTDTETPRYDSDEMAKGSGFKEVIFQTEEVAE